MQQGIDRRRNRGAGIGSFAVCVGKGGYPPCLCFCRRFRRRGKSDWKRPHHTAVCAASKKPVHNRSRGFRKTALFDKRGKRSGGVSKGFAPDADGLNHPGEEQFAGKTSRFGIGFQKGQHHQRIICDLPCCKRELPAACHLRHAGIIWHHSLKGSPNRIGRRRAENRPGNPLYIHTRELCFSHINTEGWQKTRNRKCGVFSPQTAKYGVFRDCTISAGKITGKITSQI